MGQALQIHPESHCHAVTRIDVDAARPTPGTLVLRYVLEGKLDHVRFPSVTASTRADKLWRTTCFEAFVREPQGRGYYELNFSPSTQWAAYMFADYRTGMSVVRDIASPDIEVGSKSDRYVLQALLRLDGLPGLSSDATWRLGLAAVIEEKSGRMSHWALAHPPGKADFHHPDCFAHELAAA